jgi:hypothetical protein
MFQYTASKKDIEAVETGMELARKQKGLFPLGLDDISVVMYDSKKLYVWSRGRHTVLDHKKRLKKDYFSHCGGCPRELFPVIEKILRNKHFFTCAPLTTFIKLQKERGWKGNPWKTRSSYLITLIHEFGHIYLGLFENRIPVVKQIKKLAKKYSLPRRGVIHEAFAEYCELSIAVKIDAGYAKKIKKMMKFSEKTAHRAGYEIALTLHG